MQALESFLEASDVPESDVRAILTAAAAAPSLHNAQPWRFAVRGRTIAVSADPSRRLPHVDPDDRNLHIGVGAAVFNIRVAAGDLGYAPSWRLRPYPDRALLAEVELGPRTGHRGPLADLYDAIPARRTNRQPFTGDSLPEPLVRDLVAAAGAEGATLRVFRDRSEVRRVVGLLHAAELAAASDPGRTADRDRWVGGDREREGIPDAALGPLPDDPGSAFRDFGIHGVATRGYAAFERQPTVAVLSTQRDRPTDWLRAGQALERVLLVATRAGVSASFLNQPLEDRELRWQLRSPFEGIGVGQMVLRLGYGPPVPPVPRRPLGEMLDAYVSALHGHEPGTPQIEPD